MDFLTPEYHLLALEYAKLSDESKEKIHALADLLLAQSEEESCVESSREAEQS